MCCCTMEPLLPQLIPSSSASRDDRRVYFPNRRMETNCWPIYSLLFIGCFFFCRIRKTIPIVMAHSQLPQRQLPQKNVTKKKRRLRDIRKGYRWRDIWYFVANGIIKRWVFIIEGGESIKLLEAFNTHCQIFWCYNNRWNKWWMLFEKLPCIYIYLTVIPALICYRSTI